MAGSRWTPDDLAAYRIKQKKTNPKKKVIVLRGTLETPAGEYLAQIKYARIQQPVLEFRFHPVRRWRADFAWPDRMLLVEFEGGVYSGGAHTRGKHFESDCEKYNTACLMGYRVLRITANIVKSGEALRITEMALAQW